MLLQDMRRLERAESVFRATLRNSEIGLGPNHPHTLTVVFNLAWCLCQQGRFRAAEAFFRRELAGCEATKGWVILFGDDVDDWGLVCALLA